jgi:hypothetical protein
MRKSGEKCVFAMGPPWIKDSLSVKSAAMIRILIIAVNKFYKNL